MSDDVHAANDKVLVSQLRNQRDVLLGERQTQDNVIMSQCTELMYLRAELAELRTAAQAVVKMYTMWGVFRQRDGSTSSRYRAPEIAALAGVLERGNQ